MTPVPLRCGFSAPSGGLAVVERFDYNRVS